MKKSIFLVAVVSIVLTACGPGKDPVFESKEEMAKITEKIKKSFEPKAYFNSISFFYSPETYNMITVEGNSDNTSNTLWDRTLKSGMWETTTQVTMEISGDAKPEDFLFSLDDVDLLKIPDLVADAKARAIKEKNITEAKVTAVIISTPMMLEDKASDLNFNITITPSDGGKDISVTYDLTGNFVELYQSK